MSETPCKFTTDNNRNNQIQYRPNGNNLAYEHTAGSLQIRWFSVSTHSWFAKYAGLAYEHTASANGNTKKEMIQLTEEDKQQTNEYEKKRRAHEIKEFQGSYYSCHLPSGSLCPKLWMNYLPNLYDSPIIHCL